MSVYNTQTVNANSSPPYIGILSKAGYVADVIITYMLNGKKKTYDTPNISVGYFDKIFLPPEAINLKMEFYMHDFGHFLFGIEYFPKMKQMCFAMWGTIFMPVYKQIPCNMFRENFLETIHPADVYLNNNGSSDMNNQSCCNPCYCNPCCSFGNNNTIVDSSGNIVDNKSYILLWNKGGYNAFMTVIYELNGEVAKQSTVTMSVGMIRKLFIPPEAVNLQIDFIMIDAAYITVGTEYINKMGRTCFAMWGTIFYPVYARIPCDF